MQAESRQQYVLVVCSLCGTRMHPRAEQVGQTITCPDCGTASIVRPAAPRRGEPVRPDPGEYRVAGAPGGDGKTSPNRAAPAAAYVLHKCPICGTRMHPRLEHVGRAVICPDCGTPSTILPRPVVPPRREAPELVRGQYDVGTVPPPKPLLPATYAQPRAIEDRIELDAPPHWTFFSGVFDFPWRGGALGRWATLSVGFLAAGELAAFMFGTLLGEGDVRGSVVGVGALSTVLFFLLLFTVSFAASCMVAIIQETAEGADRINEWPESDWRDWIYNMLAVGQVVFLSIVAGYGTAWLVRLTPAPAWVPAVVATVTTFVLLPFLWLSCLESGSVFAPLSIPILRSLLKLAWAWLLFYALAGLVVGATAGFATLAMLGWAELVALGFAPLAAATALIYARLLGRLGWLITQRLQPQEEAETE